VTKQKFNLLISNDDGAKAPGIEALAEVIATEHQVTVVAPSENRSGSSSALTLTRPLRCESLANGFYSVDGTPCDCVHLGSHRLMQTQPDMILSGINDGANLGDDVFYSGTVAAAMEGRSLGFPAMAISLVGRPPTHYMTAAQVALNLLSQLQSFPTSSNTVLNVNVPDLPLEQIKGYRLTRLGSRHRADTIVPAQDPRGKEVFWIGPASKPQDDADGTDFYAVEKGFVSITPLVVDFTAYASFDSVKQWIDQL